MNNQSKKLYSIAIDGPSGSGKSTLAKGLAARLGFVYLDTGALYRAVGLYVYGKNPTPSDAETAAMLGEIDIRCAYENGAQVMYLNGEDVSLRIRENAISQYASNVSKIPAVREFLLDLQKNAAAENHIIMDGRDIGTVILPNADLKIFLTAKPEARARRRCEELAQKGENVDYEDILKQIIARDKQDMSRDTAPLKPADDAVLLDNTVFSCPKETLDRIMEIIKERLPEVVI